MTEYWQRVFIWIWTLLLSWVTFDDSGTFQKPNRPELIKAIKWLSEISPIGENHSLTCNYVLDRGTLLHRIPWTKKKTYLEMLHWCWSYVLAKYPQTQIGFDGYDIAASTNDMTHLKQNRVTGWKVLFSPQIGLTTKKRNSFHAKVIMPVLSMYFLII